MPKFDYSNVTNSGEFATAARNIRARGKSLNDDVQKVLICGLKHMVAHGDYTSSIIPILDAIKDAAGGNRHVAAMEWVMKYSWLAWDDTEKKLVKDQTKTMKVDEAVLEMWYATERKPKAKPYDFQKAVEDLFAKVAAEIKAERLSADIVQNTLVAKLKAQNPELLSDMFRSLDATAQNETLALLTNIFAPANDVVEEPQGEVEVAVAA
jgi:hypothetical protein